MPGTISLADRSSVRHSQPQEEITLGRFRFGLFEFDVASRELRREGALRRLQSQPA